MVQIKWKYKEFISRKCTHKKEDYAYLNFLIIQPLKFAYSLVTNCAFFLKTVIILYIL